MQSHIYAENLRDICLAEDIKVVGFADHGSVADAEIARNILVEAGLVVFPGFEVSTTEKVHWVCLFSESTTQQQLERYLGKLNLTDPAHGVLPSTLGGQELLGTIDDFGGFCFAAHITSKNGILKGSFNNLWKNRLLRAAQIPGSADDLPTNYRNIVLNKDCHYFREQPIALINAKDITVPDDLKDPRATTYIKMTRPCFESFLMSFKDNESRVRLHDNMDKRYYSQINSIVIEGGYFDGLSAEISGHLNAVIGGRGTGKSTLLECVRFALDVSHKGEEAIRQGNQIVEENLGKSGGRVIIRLQSASNQMKTYTVIRRYGEPSRVIDEQGNESLLHPGRDLLPNVEIYGQNEIYELAKSPGALAKVLDRFLPESRTQAAQLGDAYKKLRENSNKLAKYQEEIDEVEQYIARLPILEEQAKQFKNQGIDAKLKAVPLLETERQLGPRIHEEIRQLRSGQRGFEDSWPDPIFLSDKALSGLPHAELLRRAREVFDALGISMRHKIEDIDKEIGEAENALNSIVDGLNSALKDAENQIENEFKKLPEVAGMSGKEAGLKYQGLLREIERIKPARDRLRSLKVLVDELCQERRNLIGAISDIRSARTAAKEHTIQRLNKRLDGKLRITLIPNGLRLHLREFLQDLPGVGERKTQWVDEAFDLTVFGLVAAVREGKAALLSKDWTLTPGLAETLTKMTALQVYRLEEIDLEDHIMLELNTSHAAERYRSLDQLSTGQQCTAILHLLLLDNKDPLIMDQPEDNLDNAFIADRIVQELRSAKMERQFLFATHNANIPVFGDAEWIGVCLATDNQAQIPVNAQGSIDIPVVRDHAASILDGGKEAFLQRREKYGFDY